MSPPKPAPFIDLANAQFFTTEEWLSLYKSTNDRLKELAKKGDVDQMHIKYLERKVAKLRKENKDLRMKLEERESKVEELNTEVER
jgi:predicted RNase H-like nuclease (RuvC/YqgF family)